MELIIEELIERELIIAQLISKPGICNRLFVHKFCAHGFADEIHTLPTLINTIVKIRISAQRKWRSTKSLSLVPFFMIFSLPVLLILREFSISNNSVSKFFIKNDKLYFFNFSNNFALK